MLETLSEKVYVCDRCGQIEEYPERLDRYGNCSEITRCNKTHRLWTVPNFESKESKGIWIHPCPNRSCPPVCDTRVSMYGHLEITQSRCIDCDTKYTTLQLKNYFDITLFQVTTMYPYGADNSLRFFGKTCGKIQAMKRMMKALR